MEKLIPLILTTLLIFPLFSSSPEEIPLTGSETDSVNRGDLVVRTKKVPGAPWPEVTVFSVIKAKPEECMGVFYAYHEHREFLPDLLVSSPEKYISPTDLHIYFEMNIPWPMRNSRYATGNRLKRTGNGGYRIDWYHVRSTSSKNTYGSVTFTPMGNKTLFVYRSFVHPKSGLAGIFKKRMIREVQRSVHAVIGRIEDIRKESPEKLPGYIGALHRSLKGEYIYKNIPRPGDPPRPPSH